jgi:phosphorylcholine metabolism protein LicD
LRKVQSRKATARSTELWWNWYGWSQLVITTYCHTGLSWIHHTQHISQKLEVVSFHEVSMSHVHFKKKVCIHIYQYSIRRKVKSTTIKL